MSTKLRDSARAEKIGFPFNEVRLNDKLHMVWLFRYLPLLREGLWLEDARCDGGNSRVPSFRTPIELAAEIDRRLEKAGDDGAMLEAFYGCQRSYTSLAKQFRLNWRVVRDNISKSLRYICDNQAHKLGQSYSQWRQSRRPMGATPRCVCLTSKHDFV